MDALDLDPAGYTGTYKLIGGRLSLNFVNTVSWPLTDRRHDWLSSLANVQRWAKAVHLSSHRLRSGDLDSIRSARTAIAGILEPLSHEQKPVGAAIEEFNNLLCAANGRRALSTKTLEWAWRDQTPLQSLLDPIVLDAAEVAAHQDRRRLGHCPACDWIFLDETRNGRRRWCDMADCGSRSKSRRYYERTNT